MAWRNWWSFAWRGLFGAVVGYWCGGLGRLFFDYDEKSAFKEQATWVLVGFIFGIPLLAFMGVFIGTIIHGLRFWTGKNVGAVVGGVVGGTIGGVIGALTFYWQFAPGQRAIAGMDKVLWIDVGMGLCIGFMAGLIAALHKNATEAR
jgi:hypothetical protein